MISYLYLSTVHFGFLKETGTRFDDRYGHMLFSVRISSSILLRIDFRLAKANSVAVFL